MSSIWSNEKWYMQTIHEVRDRNIHNFAASFQHTSQHWRKAQQEQYIVTVRYHVRENRALFQPKVFIFSHKYSSLLLASISVNCTREHLVLLLLLLLHLLLKPSTGCYSTKLTQTTTTNFLFNHSRLRLPVAKPARHSRYDMIINCNPKKFETDRSLCLYGENLLKKCYHVEINKNCHKIPKT